MAYFVSANIEDNFLIEYNTGLSDKLKPLKILHIGQEIDCLIYCSKLYSCNSVIFTNRSCRLYPLIYNVMKAFFVQSDSMIFIKKNLPGKLIKLEFKFKINLKVA